MDVEIFADNTSVEVVAKDVTLESVWVYNDEKIAREILVVIGHSNDKSLKLSEFY